MQQLIEHLKKSGVLYSSSILKALTEIDRADFVPENARDLAYDDVPLLVPYGQTLPEPHTVIFMLEQLGVAEGDTVLEIGYGSCWQTALLAHMVGPHGRVYGFELQPSLFDFGEQNIKKYDDLASRVTLLCSSGEEGFPQQAPFDAIICCLGMEQVPHAWREQLKPGGRTVYPTHGGITQETKGLHGRFDKREYQGYTFMTSTPQSMVQ